MKWTFITLGTALAVACVAGRVDAATLLDANLVSNGDAEASAGAANYNDVAPPVGWTTTGNFTAVRYDASKPYSGVPQSTAISGGANLFAGGPNNAESSATQTIDISDRAADIDAGKLTANLSGYFGGLYGQNDSMTLTVKFVNAQGQQYAATTIGNVRASTDGPYGQVGTILLYRSANQPVPKGTRSIVVTLRAIRPDMTSDSYNDGYADNVSLELVNTAATDTWAQSYGVASPNTDFYYGEGTDYPQGIAAMPDGGVVVVGQISTQTGNTTGHTESLTRSALIRYGQDGAILWTKLFPGSALFGTNYVVTDTQGNIYYAGGFSDPSSSAVKPYVAKFDANGVQQWFTNVKVPIQDIDPGNPGDSYINTPFTGVSFTSDGNLVLGAAVLVDGRSVIYMPAMFFVNSANGAVSCNVLRTSTFRDTTYTGAATVAASRTNPDRFALLTGNPSGGRELVLVNRSGASIATRTPVSGDRIIGTGDGGYLVMVLAQDGTYVTKFDANLNLQWEKATGQFAATSVIEGASGGFLLSGVAPDDGTHTGSNLGLLKLTSFGNLERSYSLGGAGSEARGALGPNLSSAVITSDGGFGFATTTTSYAADTSGKPDWWIGKTDSLGRILNYQDDDSDVSARVLVSDYTSPYPITDGTPFDKPQAFATQSPATALTSVDANATRRVQADAPFPEPYPPPHGGLGGTDFTVNGSHYATVQDLHDQVIRFSATQLSNAAGLFVRVQSSTTPSVEASWADLANGTGGRMLYDTSAQSFVLNTTNYPPLNDIYFRAIAAAQGFAGDKISNPVGPFNLASTKSHLPPIAVSAAVANGPLADLQFDATGTAVPAGTALRIQSTSTPANEASWTDLNDGNAGHMTQTNNASLYRLLVNKIPDANGVCFRAVASLSGYVDSLSAPIGRVSISQAVPPTVAITVAQAISGSGSSVNNRLVVRPGLLNIKASASSNRPIAKLALELDGKVLYEANPGATSIDYNTSTIGVGDHALEVVAVDDQHVRARSDASCTGDSACSGTGIVYLSVRPASAGTLKAEPTWTATAAAASTAGRTFTVAQDGGEWSDPTTWRDSNGNNGFPGENDYAIIGASSVRIAQFPAFARAVTIDGGRLIGGGARQTLYVTGQMMISGGVFQGQVGIVILGGAVCELVNSDDIQFVADANGAKGSFTNAGYCNLHGAGGIVGAAEFHNSGTLNWQTPLTVAANALLRPGAGTRAITADSPDIAGIITGRNVGALISQDGGGLVDRSGHLISQDGGGLISQDGGGLIGENGGGLLNTYGTKLITQDGGSFVSKSGGLVISNDGGSVVSHDGASVVSHDGGSVISNDGGSLVAAGGGNALGVTPSGLGGSSNPRVKAASASSALTISGGQTDLSALTLVGPVNLNGGVLSGSGIVAGNLTNNGGYVVPGHPTGGIAVTGNFGQGANGTLVLQAGGPYPTQFDQLQVGSVANLGGNLDVKLVNGYTPNPADTFNPLGYGSVSGAFAKISSNAQVTVNSTGLLASMDPSKPNPSTGQPLNISTRMEVLSGDNVLIAGFIVSGPPGSTKTVMIRGLGPSLAKAGVANPIADPLLELHEPDGTVVTNDNWQDASNTGDIPAGFQPSDPHESVIVATLTVGSGGYSNYTAILRGAHGETGVGLAEAYDLSSSVGQLANISTRGYVDTGDNVMIGGFIVGGAEPAKTLVRAIGPSLADQGVQGALAATTLEVHDGNGAVISNQGWRSTQESEIIATTIPPNNNGDSAIVATLVPGNYTAVVRGANNTTGVGLVEAYNLQ